MITALKSLYCMAIDKVGSDRDVIGLEGSGGPSTLSSPLYNSEMTPGYLLFGFRAEVRYVESTFPTHAP